MTNNGNTTPVTLKFINRWTGAVSAAWENPANWSCASVPDNNTEVVISQSAAVIINSNVVIRSLKIPPFATISVTTGNSLTITH